MPAPLVDVDREAVRAHVVTHGVREAARAFGLSADTVSAWSARYGWLKHAHRAVQARANPVQALVQALPKSMIGRASGASTPSVAAQNSLDSLLKRTRLNMAKTADRGFAGAADMGADEILAVANGLKALAGVAQVAHPELREDRTAQPMAVINIALAGLTPEMAIAAPTIALEAPEQP